MTGVQNYPFDVFAQTHWTKAAAVTRRADVDDESERLWEKKHTFCDFLAEIENYPQSIALTPDTNPLDDPAHVELQRARIRRVGNVEKQALPSSGRWR
jgi:hypothetical protein